MCLLLIQGSPQLRESLATDFRLAGYPTQAVGDIDEAFVEATERNHKVILFDVELPGPNWLELLRQMRAKGARARILLLTRGQSVAERVNGLNSGADDCVSKPVSFEELLARVRVLLRGPHRSESARIEVDDLVIDTHARSVTRSGVVVQLAAREFQLLQHLARNAGKTFSEGELDDHLHGRGNSILSNSIASAICVLRKKLAVANDARPIIHTRRGYGYYLGAVS